MMEVISKWDDEKTLVVCDFDGTLSPRDMGYSILERFSMRNEWERIDNDYKKGFIGSREAYQKVAPTLRATRREIIEYVLCYGGIDPHFESFYRRSFNSGHDLIILSDGLDVYIEAMLSRCDLVGIRYYANKVVFGDDGSLSIEFPYSSKNCGKCGNCKLSTLKKHRRSYARIVYVGDGHSDFCPAGEADVIFGKGLLYERFSGTEKECYYYDDFSDVENILYNGDHQD